MYNLPFTETLVVQNYGGALEKHDGFDRNMGGGGGERRGESGGTLTSCGIVPLQLGI